MLEAIEHIKVELKERLEQLRSNGKLLEAQRLEQRTQFDIEMIQELGYCTGIENYSRYLSGRGAGMAPPTLFADIRPGKKGSLPRHLTVIDGKCYFSAIDENFGPQPFAPSFRRSR